MKSIFFHTNQGKRNSNQDALFPLDTQASKIFIICDGVGGSYKGDIASQTVANSMGLYLNQRENITQEDISNSLVRSEEDLKNIILSQNIQGTKTTLALAAFNTNKVIIAHCGDSQVYVIRNSEIIFKTQSHTYVQFLLDREMISKEESETHPHKHAITRFIDGINPAQLDFSEVEVMESDILIVCSDGVTEGGDISSLCKENRNAKDLYEAILKVCEQKSTDNYSLFLIEV